MSHMTQTANPVTLLASPLGEEGHEVAKGVQANWIHRGASRPANPVRRHPAKSVWTVVILIMVLDVDVTAERRHYNTHRPLKGKRLTTFCASLALLQNVFAVHRKGDTTTLGAKGPVKLKNPRARKGQSILRTVPFTILLHNPPPAGGHNPRGAAPSTLTPKVCPMPGCPFFFLIHGL